MNKPSSMNPPRLLTDWLQYQLNIPLSTVTIDTRNVDNPQNPADDAPTRFYSLNTNNSEARRRIEDATITETTTDFFANEILGIHECDLNLLLTRCEDTQPDVIFHDPFRIQIGDNHEDPTFIFKVNADSIPETKQVFNDLKNNHWKRTNAWWETRCPPKDRHWHIYVSAVEFAAEKLEENGFSVALDDDMIDEQKTQYEATIETWSGLTLEDEYSRINGPLAIQEVMASLDYEETGRRWDSEDRIWLINKDATYHVAEKLRDAGFDVELKDQRINLY